MTSGNSTATTVADGSGSGEDDNIAVDGGGEGARKLSNGSESLQWNKHEVLRCLENIKHGIVTRSNIALAKCDRAGNPTPKCLGRSFMTIVGDVDLLGAKACVYRRVLNQATHQFINGSEILAGTVNQVERLIPSDMEDDLQYRPTEFFAEKVVQIVCFLSLGDLEGAERELGNLHQMREIPSFVLFHRDLDEAMEFMENTLRGLVDWIQERNSDSEIPSILELSVKAHLALKVVRAHFLRAFRFKQAERTSLLKEVAGSDLCEADWLVTTYDAVRRKRDVPKWVHGVKNGVADTEEHMYVDRAMKLDDQNPFVKLALLDCIVDSLRDSRKAITCGGITYEANSPKIMIFMKQSCRDILADFPRSVTLHSRISDYFARYVSFCFYDVIYAEECLEVAYKLNPTCPMTTHRLGIFNRMSKGALTGSFEWFLKTERLDPYHYNAFLECVKNMIGVPEEYSAAKFIDAKLQTLEACSWTEAEVLELLFYQGIAHFVRNETEECLQAWSHVVMYFQPHFRLLELEQTCGFYRWDMNRINSDQLRLWLHQENLKEDQTPNRRVLVSRLYNLVVGKAMAEKPKYSTNPLGCASIQRYFAHRATELVNNHV